MIADIMLKLVLIFICSSHLVRADSMLGPGIWSLISVSECPDQLKDEKLHMEITKHRLNRTHDGINAKIVATTTIDDTYAIIIDICKHVDGGCKQYQVITDNSAVNLINKHAKDLVTAALSFAKLDPPEFPLYEGTYEVEDFVIDWCTLPRKAPYGKFEAISNLLNGNERIGCLKLIIEFNKFEDENYCDGEDAE